MRHLARASGLLVAAAALIGAAEPPLTAHFDWFDYRGSDPVDAVRKPGPGDYRNPILQGFYSDPSVTRVGDDYYLVTSSFGYFPGIPVFHSRDLVHWTQIGNAIDRPGQLDFSGLALSRGVFAAAITHHDGLFYILNTCVDCRGNFLLTAKNPAGPWSDPVWLPEIDGIDVSLFFDDDGRAWIVNNGPPEGTPRYTGHRAIWIQQFDPKAQRMIGARKVLVDGGVHPEEKPIWIEGPHLLKHDGHYYLMAAEGGTAEGHSEVILRSDHVTGPYTPDAGNPILTQRDLPKDRPYPVTSAGHADLVQTPKGDWWATFLAVRPYGDDLYNTGRETFLLPVQWKDGWPVILPHGQAIPTTLPRPALPPGTAAQPTSGPFHIRTSFTGPRLPLDWMMLRNPRETWWKTGHGLTLEARPQRIGDTANPSYIGRRQQHMDANAETAMQFAPVREGDRAGMVALQNDDFFFFFGLVREGGQTLLQVTRRAGKAEPADGIPIASTPLSLAKGKTLYLGIDARGGRTSFRYATAPGAWTVLKADADGTNLSTKIAGGFVGTTIGVYAAKGE